MKLTLAVFSTAAALVFMGAVPAHAQLLDTTSVADQFDSGDRGGNTDSDTATANDTSTATITNTAGATGSITYTNAFTGKSKPGTEVESPVLDVTISNTSPDYSLAIAGIAANTRAGASSPSKALFIGDDGGYNAIALGSLSSKNYFLQSDLFCPDNSGVSGAGGANFTRMGISVRNNYNVEPAVDGPGNLNHTRGSFALLYQSDNKTVYACEITTQSTGNDTRSDNFSTFVQGTATKGVTVLASQVLTGGWHTFRINASNSTIQFLVDGTVIKSQTSSNNPNGAAVLFYRANGSFNNNAATDTQARFDNLSAGPFLINSAQDWNLY